MTALVTASGNSRATAASSIDRAIRLSTAAAVLAVAGIAACVSYWHAYAVVRAYGESGITARLKPATIDGLVYASSMVILEHPGFHAHLVLCDAASPGGSAVMRLPDPVPGPGFV
jgi:hypothetical protein